jgi:hypothetical protein
VIFHLFFFVDSETPNSGGAARVSPSTISFRLGYSIRNMIRRRKKKLIQRVFDYFLIILKGTGVALFFTVASYYTRHLKIFFPRTPAF